MSRCRSQSFYLSAKDKRYFADWEVCAVLPDGTTVPIKHRGDVKRIQLSYPGWDGQVRLVNAYAPELVHAGLMDANTVEGKPHLDAARAMLVALANDNITNPDSIGASAKQLAHILFGDPKFGGAGNAPVVKMVGTEVTSGKPWVQTLGTLAFVSGTRHALDPGRVQQLLEHCIQNPSGMWAPVSPATMQALCTILENYPPATRLVLLKDLWDTASNDGWSRVVNPADVQRDPFLDHRGHHEEYDEYSMPSAWPPQDLSEEQQQLWLEEEHASWLAAQARYNPDRYGEDGFLWKMLEQTGPLRGLEVKDFFAIDLRTLTPEQWGRITSFIEQQPHSHGWTQVVTHPLFKAVQDTEGAQLLTYFLIDNYKNAFWYSEIEKLDELQVDYYAQTMAYNIPLQNASQALAMAPQHLPRWLQKPNLDKENFAGLVDTVLSSGNNFSFSTYDGVVLLQDLLPYQMKNIASRVASKPLIAALAEIGDAKVLGCLAANPKAWLPKEKAALLLTSKELSDPETLLGALQDYVADAGDVKGLTEEQTGELMAKVRSSLRSGPPWLWWKNLDGVQHLLLAAGDQQDIDSFFARCVKTGEAQSLQQPFLSAVSVEELRKTFSSRDEHVAQAAGRSGKFYPAQLPAGPMERLVHKVAAASTQLPVKPKTWAQLLPVNPQMDKEYTAAESLPVWQTGEMVFSTYQASPIVTHRQLHKNATYMGNCTYGYKEELATGTEAMYQIKDAATGQVFNAHFIKGEGSWRLGEVNSRFNEGNIPEEVYTLADDIADTLTDTLWQPPANTSTVLHPYQETDLEDAVTPRSKPKHRRGKRAGA